MADKELSYDHLAMGLKEALQKDKSAFDADRLQKYTGMHLILWIKYLSVLLQNVFFSFHKKNVYLYGCFDFVFLKSFGWKKNLEPFKLLGISLRVLLSGYELRKMLKWPRPLPLEEERIRLMHEVAKTTKI